MTTIWCGCSLLLIVNSFLKGDAVKQQFIAPDRNPRQRGNGTVATVYREASVRAAGEGCAAMRSPCDPLSSPFMACT